MWMVYELRSLPLAARRSIAVALLILSGALLVLVLVHPLLGYETGIRAAFEEKQGLLRRYASISAFAPRLAETATVPGNGRELGIQPAGRSEALLLAELQGHLSQSAADQGLTVHSTRADAGAQRNGLAWIGADLSVVGPLAGLQNLLHALETGAPPLFVRRAEIAAEHSGAGYELGSGPIVSASLRIEALVDRKTGP